MTFLYITFIAFFIVSFTGLAYAQPLESINATVVTYENNQAIVEITWNHDQNITNYEIGCVSCMPNFSNFIETESITLSNVTPLPNTHYALLYLIALDSNSEIITAKQIIVDLNN